MFIVVSTTFSVSGKKRHTMEEIDYANQGRPVIGTDEVGRGCLAGPVVAAAALYREGMLGNDSKTMSEARRNAMCADIRRTNAVRVASRTAQQIDDANILQASLASMKEAVEALVAAHGLEDPIILVDGNSSIPGLAYEQHCMVKGDKRSKAIGAASIVAKVSRDEYMAHVDRITGERYGFAGHKGYGTKRHYEAIAKHGPSPYHRRTFRLEGGYSKT